MGKHKFAKKQPLKRCRASESSNKYADKKRVTEDRKVSRSKESSRREYEEKDFDAAAAYKEEDSAYDNLLKKLGNGSKSLAHLYKRRQREEEGRSDTEDEDDESGSDVVGEFDNDDGEGTEDEFAMEEGAEDELEEPNMLGDVDMVGIDDESGASESDEEGDLEDDGPSGIQASASTSSFHEHLGHKLSKEEIESLSEKKWKYKWEMPAVGMSNCKWMGTGNCFLKDPVVSPDSYLRPKLYTHWMDVYKKSGGNDFQSSKQRLFFSLCNSYRDIMHCNKKPFYLKGTEEDSSFMDAYIMHSLNHIFETRNLVVKNDAKVNKCQEAAKDEILADDTFLDHGFTRPKILLILPYASFALRVVKRLIQLIPSAHKVNVENIDRFVNEFGIESSEDGDEDMEKSKYKKNSKPSDYQLIFGGNNEDSFVTGIKFTRKSIKLYSDFYTSDIIVASPLGLITKIGIAEREKEKDVDYLSSIEVLVIDHADIILMQNWDHLVTVIEHLNHIPSKQHGTDVMRVRPWYLDGHARFYRQTIMLASSLNPDMNALYNHHCCNYQGKVKSVCEYKGVLPKVLLQVRQIYERFDTDSVESADDARLEYFTKKIFPKIKESVQGGIMIFIRHYFEYVRIRNFLKSQDASFCMIGDHTEQSDISRARVWFFEGKRKIMLYTERSHFFHRYKIRGIRNLIIYSLPERKEFYPEIVNALEGSDEMACMVLFSKFDKLKLEQIVGSSAARRMVTSDKKVFAFC